MRLGIDLSSRTLIVIFDADLNDLPELSPRFYEAYCAGLADFINGSRLVYPMEEGSMAFLNRMGNIFFAKALSLVLGVSISDSLCGTKLFSRADYERMKRWRADFGDFDPSATLSCSFRRPYLVLVLRMFQSGTVPGTMDRRTSAAFVMERCFCR